MLMIVPIGVATIVVAGIVCYLLVKICKKYRDKK